MLLPKKKFRASYRPPVTSASERSLERVQVFNGDHTVDSYPHQVGLVFLFLIYLSYVCDEPKTRL